MDGLGIHEATALCDGAHRAHGNGLGRTALRRCYLKRFSMELMSDHMAVKRYTKNIF